MFERLLLLWLCLLGLLAYFWAQLMPGFWDPFLASKSVLNYLFAVTMFALGSLLPKEEIAIVFRRWPTVLGGTAVQYTVMPFLGWSMAWLFGLDEAARIGVIIVGLRARCNGLERADDDRPRQRELFGEHHHFVHPALADSSAVWIVA